MRTAATATAQCAAQKGSKMNLFKRKKKVKSPGFYTPMDLPPPSTQRDPRYPSATMNVPNHWSNTHFRAMTASGLKFVYCPVGNICSWSSGDHDNNYCPWCKKFFSELRNEI